MHHEHTRLSAAREAILKKGQDFILARDAMVQDYGCLESIMMALIANHECTRDYIVKTVPKYVGHSYPHVATVLDAYTGLNPEKNIWYRDEDKIYRLHADEENCTAAG